MRVLPYLQVGPATPAARRVPARTARRLLLLEPLLLVACERAGEVLVALVDDRELLGVGLDDGETTWRSGVARRRRRHTLLVVTGEREVIGA